MGELLNLSVYNPSSLTDEDFLRCFVARQMVANRLIDRLRDVKRVGLATHQLLMGQRGMGDDEDAVHDGVEGLAGLSGLARRNHA